MPRRKYAKTVDHVPQQYRECRLFGHAWTVGQSESPQYSVYFLALECARCGMERVDGFDVAGRLSSRRYIQPNGYRVAPEDTPTREELRIWMYQKKKSRVRPKATRLRAV